MSPRISIRLLAAQSDQRLVALVKEGHERAFEALVQRYRRPLLRYCRRMRLSDARAEDVLQQAFLKAWLALARGAEVRDLKPWLYRIVHNAAVNTMRRASEPHGELTDALQARTAAVGESELERRIAVRDALGEVAALPQMQRQAIFLTAVDGQSHDEVASALGITQGALRGLLYRARTTLRSAAAALTPQPLLAWASGGAGGGGPTAERLAELTAGGAAAGGMAGLLMKGAVVAVTAGALATGASVVESRHGRSHATHRAASTRPASSRSGTAAAGRDTPAAVASQQPIGATGAAKSIDHRISVDRRHHANGRGQARHDHGLSTHGSPLGGGLGGGRGSGEAQSGAGRDVQVSDGQGGGSPSGSGAGTRGGSGDTGHGGSQTSGDGSQKVGSVVPASDSDGRGGGESAPQSASGHGGSETAPPEAGQSGGDHQPVSGAEAGGKTDG